MVEPEGENQVNTDGVAPVAEHEASAAKDEPGLRPAPFPRRRHRCVKEARRPGDCDIVLLQSVYQRIVEHLAADMGCERGGLLLGFADRQAGAATPTIYIAYSLPAQHSKGTPSSLTFTETTWLSFQAKTDELEQRGARLQRVGWYHSHPGSGVFLSKYDLDVCTNFSRGTQMALVVDPVRDLGGFFVKGEVGYRRESPQGFWEFPDLQRESVVTWKNMKEVEPGSDGSVPRLSAQAIVDRLGRLDASSAEAQGFLPEAPEGIAAAQTPAPDHSTQGEAGRGESEAPGDDKPCVSSAPQPAEEQGFLQQLNPINRVAGRPGESAPMSESINAPTVAAQSEAEPAGAAGPLKGDGAGAAETWVLEPPAAGAHETQPAEPSDDEQHPEADLSD